MPDDALQDIERTLSLAYAPVAKRGALTTLWRLDERLARIVAEPNAPIAAIKLAWWREALAALDDAPPPPEPLLRAVATELCRKGVSGKMLADIAAGWDALIADDEDESVALTDHARLRGGGLFGAAATLLGAGTSNDVRAAGEIWALTTLPPPLAATALALAAERCAALPPVRWPRALRTIGLLAVMARQRATGGQVTPGSPLHIARSIWHGLSGR